VIHYHGGPITPLNVAQSVWTARHAFVSFQHPDQVAFAAEVCQSFALDNGAFSAWMSGKTPDWDAYADWCFEWGRHPGCDFAVIPDVVDGDEQSNDELLEWWDNQPISRCVVGVPVWHLHESFERLQSLCQSYRRVALGSSGAWSTVGTPEWWQRMGSAMDAVCDDDGIPPAKLHGLRMLNPTVFSQLPLASADSTNVARNHARERSIYRLTEAMASLALVTRIESHASAPRWNRTFGTQQNFDLVG